MGKKSGPAPPDPVATANAQAAANEKAAITQQKMNMVDQFTPYGNLIYSQGGQWDEEGYDEAMKRYQTELDAFNARPTSQTGLSPIQQRGFGMFGGGPKAPTRESFGYDPLKYTATTTLTPDQQRMLDLSNRAAIQFGEIGNEQLDRVGDRFKDPLDFSHLGAAPVANEETRQNATASILNRMNPVWNQDEERLHQQLANQGIMQGSEAWRRGIDDFNRMKTDARLAADQFGGQEMARTYGLEQNARNQAINELIQQRQLPLNELVALTQGQQVQSPSFVNTPHAEVDPAPIGDYIYANYQGRQQNFENRNNFNSALMGGLFGMGSMGILAGGLGGGGIRVPAGVTRMTSGAPSAGNPFTSIWGR